MSKRLTNENDIALYRKVFLWLQWGQAVVGIFLLYTVLRPVIHGIFAILTAAVLALYKWGWEKRGARVFARIFSGLPWVFTAAALVTVLLANLYDQDALTTFYSLCLVGAPLLTLQGLAAGILSLRGALYDRILAGFSYTLLTLIAILTNFTDVEADVLWTVNSPVLQMLWVLLVTATALLSWLCLLARTEEQKTAAKAKREAAKANRT